MFEVKSVSDLCVAAKILGNGAASSEAIAGLISAAKTTDLGNLFKGMVARAQLDAEQYENPALKLERYARIAGLTGEEADFQRAIGLIPSVLHRCARAQAKKLVVQAYVVAGRIDEARVFARIIKSAYWGAESWVKITEASKIAADREQAESCCRNINDPLAKEEVEAQIRALRV